MTAHPAQDRAPSYADFLLEHAQVLSIALSFLLCCLAFTALSPYFLQAGNILNLLRQLAPMLIVAVAMTFVITTGGIDLSVGSTVALTNALAAIALAASWPWPVVSLAMLALGAGVGAAQGWFIAFQQIPSFIVTLAGLSMLRGLALLLTQGYSVPIGSIPGFLAIGRGWVFGMPVPALLAVAVAILGHVTLGQTLYGRQITAVGTNLEAARRVGMPARRVAASAFVLTGIASALAGLVIAARLGSGSSNAAVGFELDVIAAVVHDDRHRAWRAHHRGDRQRADPVAHFAVFRADRHRRHYPRRNLAQHAGVLHTCHAAPGQWLTGLGLTRVAR